MTQDVYERLAAFLDSLPAGFPRTESGVEIRILKRLFTKEEAALACHLAMWPEPVDTIAQRVNKPVSELADTLYEMSRKGLIVRSDRAEGSMYMAAQYVIGIWEYHVNDLDEGLIKDMNEYIPSLFDAMTQIKTQQLRTIPIGASLEGQGAVMPYEDARQLIEKQRKILVAPCICRKEHTMIGKGCEKLKEACLVFSSGAYFYEKNGIGRSITKEEALDILRQAEEQGLVLQPSNAQRIMNICLCCGDCCQVLKAIKRHPNPAELVHSNYYATVRADECIACETCLERCQMDAIQMKDDVAEIDPNRCIGCGLCVTTCGTQAIDLIRKDENDCHVPPADIVETYMRIAQERGLIK
jgi:electron transport complex protein RnfB